MPATETTSVRVIDTHTGGEPTRVIIAGGPDLGQGTLHDRRSRLAGQFDHFRSAVINEPRGSDVMVGALLCPPAEPDCCNGVIFFNNIGCINMCGHGTIGVAVALAHLGRIQTGRHRLDTPVGPVAFEMLADGRVSLDNVPSYRHRKDITVDVPGAGPVTGDIAWGGNWFFLVHDHGQVLDVSRVQELTAFTRAVRSALDNAGIAGKDGQVIDHIELTQPSDEPGVDSRNFVLCPGGAWDRSPCGTGTSAKLACLAADGQLEAGQVWRQQSVVGSVFEATYRRAEDGAVIPTICGSAWVTAEATLLLDPRDPFCHGFRT